MRRRSLVLALLGALTLALTGVAPALAAVPNETSADAIDLTALGTTVTEDTTTSDTTDPFETSLNEFCGAPRVEHGVWFTFTPAADGWVKFNTEESDYAVGIMLFGDTPTPESLRTCGPDQIVDFLLGGQTYYFMTFGDGESAATSGTMILHVDEAVPPPEISMTVNRTAKVDRSGVAHLTGTVTCTSVDGSGTVFDIFGDVTQRVGRLLIRGFFDTFLDSPCDGTTQAWDAFVQGDNGVFAGGKAATVAISFGCTDVCSEAFVEQTVQFKRSGK
jgi:hypothetical protein